ncbi:MAG TPA: hypothetical protein DCZ71_07200 [Ruminococcus sp.]|nr:hypothetical protein [Ruminococcus sp.]
MSFERLEKNLTDNIHEAQIKLGYSGRPMSLNYMLSTLEHLAGEPWTEQVWERFCREVSPRLGVLTARPVSGGYCITIPPEGTAYVHEKLDGVQDFISELIETVRSHVSSADEVVGLFRKWSDSVEVCQPDSEEVDLAVRFTDGIPDEYVYCLTAEPCMDGGCHISYHRFIPEDYRELGL